MQNNIACMKKRKVQKNEENMEELDVSMQNMK
jgi:hypothetical protein